MDSLIFRLAASAMRLLTVASPLACVALAQAPRVKVTVAANPHAGPLTGRLVLAIARTASSEPRLALSMRGSAIFGVDMEAVPAGTAIADHTLAGNDAHRWHF